MATGGGPAPAAATSLVSPPHRMQRELVGQLQEALLAREAAEAAQRGQQRALAASRTLGAFRQAVKERLAGAFSAWVRALLALVVTATSEQSSLALRNAKALAERRANALGDTRASALVAQEQARQAAEELDAVKRASAATEFRHKGYGVRFKALELAATEARRKEQAVRQAARTRALGRLLDKGSALPLARSVALWRLHASQLSAGATATHGVRTGSTATAAPPPAAPPPPPPPPLAPPPAAAALLSFFGLSGHAASSAPSAASSALSVPVPTPVTAPAASAASAPAASAASAPAASAVSAPAASAGDDLLSDRRLTAWRRASAQEDALRRLATRRLGRLLDTRRAERLGRGVAAWRRSVLGIVLSAALAHARESYALILAERNKVVHGNERWRARASAQLESRAEELGSERALIERERQLLSAQREGLVRQQKAHELVMITDDP
jgi:hypothetical protein